MVSLAQKVKQVLDLPEGVSEDTKNTALRELIDMHLLSTRYSGNRFAPLLDRVVYGETTFHAEYAEYGTDILFQASGFTLFSGNVFLEEEVEILDQAVQRVYKQ